MNAGVDAAAVVAELSAACAMEGGRIVLDSAVLDAWQERSAALGEADRDGALEGILALACRFHREAPEAASGAIHQLMELAAVLLVSEDAAAAVFAAVGLPGHAAAARVTGASAVSSMPVNTGGSADGSSRSVMSVRLGGGGAVPAHRGKKRT